MRRRFCIMALVLVIGSLFFTSCSKSIPANMSEETYRCGMDALEVMNQYLDGKTAVDDAGDELLRILDVLEAEREKLEEESGDGNGKSFKYLTANNAVTLDISLFGYAMLGGQTQDGKDFDCLSIRESLMDSLGMR